MSEVILASWIKLIFLISNLKNQPIVVRVIVLFVNRTSETLNEGNETAVIPDGFRRRMLETTEDNNTRLKYGNELCAQGYVGFKCEACDEY